MAYRTTCPGCSRKLKIRDEMVGVSIRCPGCGDSFVVTSLGHAGPRTLEAAPAAITVQPEGDSGAGEGEGPPPSSSSGGTGRGSPGHARAQPTIGRLGRFELKRTLGRGGFGTVHLAYDPVLDRSVALKMPRFSPDQRSLIERFLREGKSAANLHHPNIVAVFESGRAGDDYYIASEFVPGRPLSEVIRDRGASEDLREAAAWVRDLARALGYAHGLGVIHRDIKPQNVMLDEQGRPRILDFGLAKRLDEDATMTTEGSLLGTPAYMAPEQARGETRSVGPRSDQYSLGAVLYELIAGRRPFDGPPHAVVAKVAAEEPPPLRSLRADVPADLAAICQKAMEKDPARRYATAEAFADDLERWRADRPTEARPISRARRVVRWCRRNPAPAGALAAVGASLVAMATLSGLYAGQQRRFAAEQARANERNAKLAADLEASLGESNRRLAAQQLQRGLAAFEQDEVGAGLLWAVEGLRSAVEADDPRWQRAARANLAAWGREHPPLRAVFSHARPIGSIAVSPDGRLVATASEDQTARVWDLATGAPIGPPLEHPGGAYCVAFSPDGRRLAVGTEGAVRLWDPAGGRPLGSIPAPGGVFGLAYDPRGTRLAAFGPGGAATLWEQPSGKAVGTLDAGPGAATALAFSPDGRTILTGHDGAQAQLWDADSLRPIGAPIRTTGGRVMAIAFSPDGRSFATGGGRGAQVWDVATMAARGQPLWHGGGVRAVAFRPDGRSFVTASVDRTARIWDAASRARIGPVYRQQGPILTAAFTPDGRTLLTAGGDFTGRAWGLDRAGRAPRAPEQEHPGGAVAFTPDGRAFLAGGERSAQLWETATGRAVGPPLVDDGGFNPIAIGPGGKIALAGSAARTAKLWDLASGRPIGRPMGHAAEVTVVAISPDGRTLLTGGQDRTARLWDASDQRPLLEPLRQTGGVDAGAFSPDGRTVVVGTDTSNVRLYDVATGSQRGETIPHHGAVSGLAFSPDGRYLLVGGEDSTAQLWDLATRRRAVPPLQHRSWVYSVAFGGAGGTMLTGSWDTTARLWDAATGVPIGPAYPQPASVYQVAFSPSGDAFLTGCGGKARLFRTVPDHPDPLERTELWVAVLTGLSLDPAGTVQPLDHDTWRSRRRELARWAGPDAGAAPGPRPDGAR
ncbi:Serine/threonine-protein kinase PrkC [Aquisphaera giovannonii]|uniref:non-specific serine/threonine protein kinase n=1 Tax=Aquisphaera giovannonii TaxID=406548 RepID=A0A5B9W4R8_9BACT|nr:protein kinase [Aquisphaera giovannonii]QEH35214.1 Serine/threonine-protein kinase PrkC [Aquisphaera giovannonii]